MKGMELLGLKTQDKVTNQEGVITCISYDLYGCIQAIVTPKSSKNVKQDGTWYDIQRLKVLSKRPVMKIPDFEEEVGPEMKPIR